jgi:hypothetical protein
MRCRRLRLSMVRIFQNQPSKPRTSLSKRPYSLKYMGNKDILVRFDIEQPSLVRNLAKLALTAPSEFGVQQSKERGKEIHLQIMSHPDKVNIPLMRVAQKHQMVSHRGILITSQIEQVWKNYPEGLIPTPHCWELCPKNPNVLSLNDIPICNE